MEGISPGLVIDAIENGFIVPDVVDWQEFGRVEEMGGAHSIDRDEIADQRRAEAEGGILAPGSERSPVGVDAAEGTRAQARFRRGIHHQARFIAVLRVGRAGNQLHALYGVGRKLGGEDLALLIADCLAVD